MSFQRLSERVEGKSRPPESRWKVVPQSRTSGWETPITEFMCSWNKQLPNVIGIGLQWAMSRRRPMSDRRRQSSAWYAGASPPSVSVLCKIGWNRFSSFNSVKLSIFCMFGLKTPIRAPKIGVFGVFHPKWPPIRPEAPCERICTKFSRRNH